MSRQPGMILILIGLLASSCTLLSMVTPAITTLTPVAGLPNPASVFCQEQGFRKLGFDSRSQAAAWAVRVGLNA